MLVGGGSNKTVKWASAQSIVIWATYIVLAIVIPVLTIATHISMIGFLGLIAGCLVSDLDMDVGHRIPRHRSAFAGNLRHYRIAFQAAG